MDVLLNILNIFILIPILNIDINNDNNIINIYCSVCFVDHKVKYFNNKVICDLIEESHKGIIAIMDEGCRNVGKVTDEVYQ